VARLEPRDGATGVFRDSAVLARLTHPVEPSSAGARSFIVEDPEGPVPGRVSLSADGLILVWHPVKTMKPGVPHFVVISGLRDAAGRAMRPHLSRFVTGWLLWEDVSG
jgi:hypothetical protein